MTMMQKTPVRRSRPYAQKLMPVKPMTTGQRIIDTLFPVAKAAPRPFPAPSARHDRCAARPCHGSDVDIVVYIGCGERGNEMTTFFASSRNSSTPAPARPDEAYCAPLPTPQICLLPPARRRFTPASRLQSISVTWATRGPHGRLHLPLGRKPFADVGPT
jgi:hypothetical protein